MLRTRRFLSAHCADDRSPGKVAPPSDRPLPRPNKVALRPNISVSRKSRPCAATPTRFMPKNTAPEGTPDPLGVLRAWPNSAARSTRRWSALSTLTRPVSCRRMRAKTFAPLCVKGSPLNCSMRSSPRSNGRGSKNNRFLPDVFEALRRDRDQDDQNRGRRQTRYWSCRRFELQLTARADRIELNKDGTVTLVDYKDRRPTQQ